MDPTRRTPPPPPARPRSSWRERRALERADQDLAVARRGEALRAEARRCGRAAVERTGGAATASGVSAPVRAELVSWAAVRVGRTHRARGDDRLPPAPDGYELGHATAGLVLGAAVFVGALVAADAAADHGRLGLALLVGLLGVLGGPSTFLALALPELFDPRVPYWSRELTAEALRAAHEAAVRLHREAGPGPHPGPHPGAAAAGRAAPDDGGVMPR